MSILNYYISTDKNKMDINTIHNFLCNQSHWAKNIPIQTVINSIDNSLNFGLFLNTEQVGFARVISDYATIAYLGDVFILEPHRGLGLSKLLMEYIMHFPQLQGLRRWILLTADAHGLYEQFGWKYVAKPELYMEFHNPNVYK